MLCMLCIVNDLEFVAHLKMSDHDSYSFGSHEHDIDMKINEDELLISLVQSYPHLYNKELKHFKDTIAKDNSWQEIGKILQMDANTCQNRWQRLRERYSREKKRQQSETSTGSRASTGKPFIYFNEMQFLDRFVKRRKRLTKKQLLIHKCRTLSSGVDHSKTNFNCEFASAPEANVQHPESSINSSHEVTSIRISAPREQKTSQRITRTTNRALQQSQSKPTSMPVSVVLQQSQETLDGDIQEGFHVSRPGSSSDNPSRTSTPLPEPAAYIQFENSQSDTDTDYVMDKSLSERESVPKSSQKTDYLENAIMKMTSIVENRLSSKPSMTVLNPNMSDDVSFCQYVLTTIIKIPEPEKTNMKKKMLQILLDL